MVTHPVARLLACSLIVLALAACDDEEKMTLLLVDDACRCDQRSLETVAALRVRLEGTDSHQSDCISQSGQPQRLAALQQTLHGSTDLAGLSAGAYSLTVVGYKDGSCGSDVVARGYATFALPSASPAIDVPMRCQLDSSGDPTTITEKACLEQTTPPDRCIEQPGGGTNEIAGAELTDSGNCVAGDVEHADSVAVALYDSSGKLLRRKCFSISGTPNTVKDLQDALSTPLLTQLAGGDYTLMVTSHDNSSCPDDEVVACGGAKITLPLSGNPKIAMVCHDEKTPITEAACLATIK